MGGKPNISNNVPGAAPKCPRLLSQGLLLEDRNILLDWGAQRIHLTSDCRPDHLDHHISWDELTWDAPVLFHGLKVDRVQVVLYPYGWLDGIWIWLAQGDCLKAATKAFHQARDHLTDQLGKPFLPPAEERCDGCLEIAAWEWQDTRINLFLRAGDEFERAAYFATAHIAHRSG